MMRLLAQRLAQIFLIQLLDIGILMRFPDLLACIFPVNRFRPGLEYFCMAVVQGLPSPSYASARAGHDFNHMVFALMLADFLQ